MKRAQTGPEAALAAVLGGAVTREKLLDAARSAGRERSGLVRSLLAQGLPSVEDLGRVYAELGGPPRLDASLLRPSPEALRVLDRAFLRKERCLLLEVFPDLAVLAVVAGRARRAVEAVRAALRRDVLPVLVDDRALEQALAREQAAPPGAVERGPLPRRDSPVHARFRDLVLDGRALDPLPLPREAPAP